MHVSIINIEEFLVLFRDCNLVLTQTSINFIENSLQLVYTDYKKTIYCEFEQAYSMEKSPSEKLKLHLCQCK